MFLLTLTLACAQRTWTPEMNLSGSPEIVAVDPRYFIDASVEDAGFGDVLIRIQVTEAEIKPNRDKNI